MRTALACTAAKHGRADCLRVILGKGINLNGSVSAAAAGAGNLPCLELAHLHGDRWGSETMSQAASNGAGHQTYLSGQLLAVLHMGIRSS